MFFCCRHLIAFYVALAASPALADPSPARPQVVLISFDGAHDLAQWQRSRVLAARTGARFTYFLSCVFLLSKETRKEYVAPGKGPGRSSVGFAETRADVRDRLAQIWLARSEGHEIAGHGCGHFDGAAWTKAQWLAEFGEFRRIVRHAYAINGTGGEPAGWRRFAETEISGFRAPYLAAGSELYPALAEAGYAYDASGVSREPVEPEPGTLARFSLPQVAEGPKGRRVIAMDYNLFVRHSGGFERTDTDGVFEARAYEAFAVAFGEQFSGDRIPLQIGFHFTLMNGGAYWRALERFAADVCVRPGVACMSYGDYLASGARIAGHGKAGG